MNNKLYRLVDKNIVWDSPTVILEKNTVVGTISVSDTQYTHKEVKYKMKKICNGDIQLVRKDDGYEECLVEYSIVAKQKLESKNEDRSFAHTSNVVTGKEYEVCYTLDGIDYWTIGELIQFGNNVDLYDASYETIAHNPYKEIKWILPKIWKQKDNKSKSTHQRQELREELSTLSKERLIEKCIKLHTGYGGM